ncbi:MAG: hypothetical protein HY804_11445 [Nitrospinae bacterium]|nr:hypothetical protein [Nitrospinota bacterium]
MFIGRHESSLDQKGRLHLPAKIRDILTRDSGEPLIVTISSRCLVGWPKERWRARVEAEEAKEYSPERGDMLRAVTEHAAECPLKNGRVLIPAWLREYAGIEREAVIIGRNRFFEIWSKGRHGELAAGYDYAKLSEQLRKLGF